MMGIFTMRYENGKVYDGPFEVKSSYKPMYPLPFIGEIKKFPVTQETLNSLNNKSKLNSPQRTNQTKG